MLSKDQYNKRMKTLKAIHRELGDRRDWDGLNEVEAEIEAMEKEQTLSEVNLNSLAISEEEAIAKLAHELITSKAELARLQTDNARCQQDRAALVSIRDICNGADTGEMTPMEAIADIVWHALEGDQNAH